MNAVAVGGVGGSGTRLVALLLNNLGYYIGDDLNDALDNLWFTLFFKRRSILIEEESSFRALLGLFLDRMSGRVDLTPQERDKVAELAQIQRLHHDGDWLRERARSFVRQETSRRLDQPWAWKEPNTHIVIDRILPVRPELKYIHTLRHPMYMSQSKNQRQLENWAPIFFSRNFRMEPRWSLKYWCAAHRRMAELTKIWPDRIINVDFDELCESPEREYKRIAGFLDMEFDPGRYQAFARMIRKPSEKNRPKINLDRYDRDDLNYIESIGFEVPRKRW